jgi:hypothetical protein
VFKSSHRTRLILKRFKILICTYYFFRHTGFFATQGWTLASPGVNIVKFISANVYY